MRDERDFWEMLRLVRGSLFVQSLYLNSAVLSIRYNSRPEVLLFSSGGFTRCVLHTDRTHLQTHTHPADIIQDRLCWMLTSLIVKTISTALLSLMSAVGQVLVCRLWSQTVRLWREMPLCMDHTLQVLFFIFMIKE